MKGHTFLKEWKASILEAALDLPLHFFSSLTIFVLQFHAKLTPFKVHQEEPSPSFSALWEPAPHAVSFTQECVLAQRLEEDSLQPDGRRAEHGGVSPCLLSSATRLGFTFVSPESIHTFFLISVLHHTLLRLCYLSI